MIHHHENVLKKVITFLRTFSSSLTIYKLSWAISERMSYCSVVSNFGMNFAHTRVIPKILLKISQTVVFGIPRSFSSSRTVNRRTRLMFSGVVVSEGRPERGSLSTDVRPFLNRLYHAFICVMPILSSTKAFCIISIVSVQLLPRLKQNLMQIRWSVLFFIFNCKQMRRTEKARWTQTHAARDPRRPASNYGNQGVREGLLVTLIPRRGRSSALARRYKRRSDTFRIHPVQKTNK